MRWWWHRCADGRCHRDRRRYRPRSTAAAASRSISSCRPAGADLIGNSVYDTLPAVAAATKTISSPFRLIDCCAQCSHCVRCARFFRRHSRRQRCSGSLSWHRASSPSAARNDAHGTVAWRTQSCRTLKSTMTQARTGAGGTCVLSRRAGTRADQKHRRRLRHPSCCMAAHRMTTWKRGRRRRQAAHLAPFRRRAERALSTTAADKLSAPNGRTPARCRASPRALSSVCRRWARQL